MVRRDQCVRGGWLVSAPLFAVVLMATPAAGLEGAETWGHPQPAVHALDVLIRGDIDRFDASWRDLGAVVVDRSVRVGDVRKIAFDGVSWLKQRGDRRVVELRARVHVVRKGQHPRLQLKLGEAGGVRVTVRAAGKVLADAERLADGERELDVVLPAARLCTLRPVPRTRFPRLALGFYYAWYGRADGPTRRWRHWDARLPHNGIHDTPTLDLYDSMDPAVIDQHMRWAKEAGLDGLIVSWWHAEEPTQAHLKLLLDAAASHGLRMSVYIEEGVDLQRLRRDARQLLTAFGKHPAWLHVDGKPLLMGYGRLHDRHGADGVAVALGGLGAYLCVSGLDAEQLDRVETLHTYFHAEHYEQYVGGLDLLRRASVMRRRPLVATVMPAYDDRNIRPPGFALEPDDGARWRHNWAMAQGADWVLLTSFNEWHEGSQIEPSLEHGSSRIEATRTAIAAWKAAP